MADEKLTDLEVYERLHDALLALGRETGETVRGDTSLSAARKSLTLLQMGLLSAIDDGSDKNPVIGAQDG